MLISKLRLLTSGCAFQKPVEIRSLEQSSIQDNRADAVRLGDIAKGIAIEEQKISAFANAD